MMRSEKQVGTTGDNGLLVTEYHRIVTTIIVPDYTVVPSGPDPAGVFGYLLLSPRLDRIKDRP